MHHRHRRRGQRIVEVSVKGSDLIGEQQALIDNGSGREGWHVEFRQAGHAIFLGNPFERVMHLLADRQNFAFKGILVGQVFAFSDDRLANQRHLGEHGFADARGIDWHIAPANHVLTFLRDETLKMGRRIVRFFRVRREEAHRDRIVAYGRQGQLF